MTRLVEREEKRKKHDLLFGNILDIIEHFIYILLIIVFFFGFVFRVTNILGISMADTLQNGDKIIVSAFAYTPENGDIVVFSKPEFSDELLVKRIIAVAGQTVDIDFNTGAVTVDGKVLDEPYLKNFEGKMAGEHKKMDYPMTVPDKKVFVMGDNRNRSEDSRSPRIEFVDERYILGEVKGRIFPFGEWTVE